jgi:transcriptional regulator with GAF, ATPase, and Fis domain
MTDASHPTESNLSARAADGSSAPAPPEEPSAAQTRLEQYTQYLLEEIKFVYNFDAIIGQSPALRAVQEKVRLVAPTDTTVLILGEIGTGKELIARALHAHSKRRDGPFVKVNCAALPEPQLEGELFGPEAAGPRIGRFELADGGTLFLKEIAVLSPAMQARLLRLLQEREFERIGGPPVKVNVRVLAATSRDLRRMREERLFREDLYYRLSVSPILLPPLRDRREDIPLLAQYLVNKFAAPLGKPISTISAASVDRLTAYPWPGNVRELENVLERAVLLAPGPVLEVGPDLLGAAPVAGEPLDLATLERNHIRNILDKTRWVIDGPHGAARLLGLHPNTLRSRLKKLGIQRPSQESP